MPTSETPNTPIRPQDIDTSRRFMEAFGNMETEISANWVVLFCQRRGKGWAPISLSELQAFYVRELGKKSTFTFNRLTGDKYVTVDGDKVVLTTRFVARCYASSPVHR